MNILLWLVPPLVVTVGAMLWVTWLGRARRGAVDRDVAVRRLGHALEKDLPRADPLVRLRERSTGIAVRPTRDAS